MRILDRITESKILWKLKALLPKLEKLVKEEDNTSIKTKSYRITSYNPTDEQKEHNKKVVVAIKELDKTSTVPSFIIDSDIFKNGISSIGYLIKDTNDITYLYIAFPAWKLIDDDEVLDCRVYKIDGSSGDVTNGNDINLGEIFPAK